MQDAAKTEADQTIETLRDDARTQQHRRRRHSTATIRTTLQDTDSIQINIHGVDPAKTQQFRNLVAESIPTGF